MIKHKRGTFPLSDTFKLFCPPELLELTHVQLETRRTDLLNLSNSRPLNADEVASLEAVTHVINVHRALDKFDDWNPGDHDLTHADQLHGNSRQHECGCHLHVVFNHYDHSHIRGHRIHQTCRKHREHKDAHKLMKALEG